MKLRYEGERVEPRVDAKKSGRLKYFVGAAVLATGIAIAAGRDAKPVSARVENEPTTSVASAKPVSTCESVFDRNAEMRIEGMMSSALRAHTRELRARANATGRLVINLSLGVDREGRVRIEDAWTTPESGLSANDIAELARPNLGAVRLEAPAEGNRCSYSMPVVIDGHS